MKNVLLVICFSFFSYQLFSQNSFSILLKSEEQLGLNGHFEMDNENYLIFYEKSPLDWKIPEVQGFILKISPNGDTSSIQLNSGDTVRWISQMVKIDKNHYLSFGSEANPPDYGIKLLVQCFDSTFQIIWKKSFKLPGYTYFRSMDILNCKSGLLYLTGSVALEDNLSLCRPYLIKINQNGDTLSTKYLENATSGWFYSSTFNPDSTKIWMFGSSYGNIVQSCRVEADTNFLFLSVKPLGGNYNGPMNTPLAGKLLNNNSIILLGTYLMELQQPQDNDLGISITDTALSQISMRYFGAIDTIDYPADVMGLDFIHPDSIFYAGTHNLIPFYYSTGVSWIMTGMLDQNLETRYEQYYGGDAYYRTSLITATKDGGSLISSAKIHPFTQYQDILILKLTPDGLITNVNEKTDIKHQYALLYPNPGNDELYVRTGLKNATFSLYNLSGSLVLSKKISQGQSMIRCNNLAKGLYNYKITVKEQIMDFGKWIKN